MVPQNIFDKYVEYTEAMITDFGVDCEIFYPALRIECPNCYFNNLPGVSSSNIYRPGGPYPFDSQSVCPYCEGLGYKLETTTETIKLRAYFDKKSWNKIRVPIGIPDGSVWTIGRMSDLIKIQRADYISIPTNLTTPFQYTLFEEPIPWGLKRDRYFSAFWKRGK